VETYLDPEYRTLANTPVRQEGRTGSYLKVNARSFATRQTPICRDMRCGGPHGLGCDRELDPHTRHSMNVGLGTAARLADMDAMGVTRRSIPDLFAKVLSGARPGRAYALARAYTTGSASSAKRAATAFRRRDIAAENMDFALEELQRVARMPSSAPSSSADVVEGALHEPPYYDPLWAELERWASRGSAFGRQACGTRGRRTVVFEEESRSARAARPRGGGVVCRRQQRAPGTPPYRRTPPAIRAPILVLGSTTKFVPHPDRLLRSWNAIPR